MKKNIWLLCLLYLGFISCDEGTNESDFLAGEQFTNSNVRVVFLDTLTVETSTMKFDSINTTEASRVLIGKYNDSVFGEVRASSFFEVLPDSYTIDSEAVFDSIVFYLKQDSYYYNDTLQSNTIHIKKVAERLKPVNGDIFYNTSSAPYFEEDIGYIQYKPRPVVGDSLEIRMDDSFGKELFEQLQQKLITNQDQFNEYLKGLTLQPGEADNGSIIGFSYASTDTYMRLYFSTPEVNENVQSSLRFGINRSALPIPFFNQVTSNPADGFVDSLSTQSDFLSSTATNNETYIQSGIGIATRIQFPSLKTLNNLPGEGTILGATLKIRPVSGTYNDLLPLRDLLGVYIVDRNNNLVAQLETSDATLNRSEQEYGQIYYEISLGSYLDELFVTPGETGEALILLPSDYNSTVDRFILNGGSAASGYRATLELTYAIYDEQD